MRARERRILAVVLEDERIAGAVRQSQSACRP
jgi:hypothetical protein